MELDETQTQLLNRCLAEVGEENPLQRWQGIVEHFRSAAVSPRVYRAAWERCFQNWNDQKLGPAPIWAPSEQVKTAANVAGWMKELGFEQFLDFHRWTIEDREEFWRQAALRLGIRFRRPASEILDLSQGPAHAGWFIDAELNIVESCFQSPAEAVAIVVQQPGGPLAAVTYGELRRQANRVSNSLVDAGFKVGEAIAVVLPMTAWSVPIYLGIIQAGCLVVSIADSFAPPEIASRLKISAAKLVFTYDVQVRAGKTLPLYSRVAEAAETPAVVLSWSEIIQVDLRDQDQDWESFLVDRDQFEPVQAGAQETINILFSSGTTGDPKAIPWNHLTPIKCAVDGYVHQDIQPGHVCAWPTNLGWMMGPWLIFASLINRATIALYEDAPMGAGFGQFVQDAQVSMLGVVPTVVKAWQASGEMERFDWSRIHVFSSTGESSQRDEMVYLSSLAKIKPIIEYCGGTEIGGGYVTSTVMQPNVPAAFNTPAVGLDFVLVDEELQVGDQGEVFLIPPSIGLSSRLVNRDHFETYYAGTPEIPGLGQLRRHGDHFCRLPGGYYVAGGRVDDTMNLGGIKISSAEIERVLNRVGGIKETAAVAISAGGGPSQLVVYCVLVDDQEPDGLLKTMNLALREQLNPLFKVESIKIADSLPRTASGKVLRRKLRDHLAR